MAEFDAKKHLPDLGSSVKKWNFDPRIKALAEGLLGFREGSVGHLHYEINPRALALSGQFGGANLNGRFGYDGLKQFEMSKPMLGGNLALGLGKSPWEGRNAFLRFEGQF